MTRSTTSIGDPLGIQSYPVWQEGEQVIYAKHLEDGSMAVGFFNRGLQSAKMAVSLRQLGLRGEQTVRDLWQTEGLDERLPTSSRPKWRPTASYS